MGEIVEITRRYGTCLKLFRGINSPYRLISLSFFLCFQANKTRPKEALSFLSSTRNESSPISRITVLHSSDFKTSFPIPAVPFRPREGGEISTRIAVREFASFLVSLSLLCLEFVKREFQLISRMGTTEHGPDHGSFRLESHAGRNPLAIIPLLPSFFPSSCSRTRTQGGRKRRENKSGTRPYEPIKITLLPFPSADGLLTLRLSDLMAESSQAASRPIRPVTVFLS